MSLTAEDIYDRNGYGTVGYNRMATKLIVDFMQKSERQTQKAWPGWLVTGSYSEDDLLG